MRGTDNSRVANPRDAALQTMSRLLQLAIIGLLIGALLFQGVELPITVKALFVVLLLLLVGRTSAMPLLVAFQIVLFFREIKSTSPANGLGSSLFVVIVLGLLMFLSRDQTLKRFTRRSVSDLARSVFSGGSDFSAAALPEQRDSWTSPANGSPPSHSSLVQNGVALMCYVLVAQLWLTAFPLPGDVQRGQQSYTEAKQALASAPSLVVLILTTVILMSWLSWRRLTAEQASLYARSTLVTLLYSDLRLIVRHRIHFRRRKRKPTPVNIALEIEQAIPLKDKRQKDVAQNAEGKKHRSFRLS